MQTDWEKIDQTCTKIRSILDNYEYLIPLNIEEEYEKFVASKEIYNPQFIYKKFPVQQYINTLHTLNIPTTTKIGQLFFNVQEYLLKWLTCLKQLGTEKFHTKDLFGNISDELISKAENILKETIPEEDKPEKTITSEELGKILQTELNSYQLKGWKIIFRKHTGSAVNVSGGSKRIIIRNDELFSKKHIQKLRIHEIGTHVLRGANGELQNYKIFMAGLPNYLSTEEGLAGYNERSQGINNPKTKHTYARHVISAKKASTGSFVNTYQFIRPFFDDNKKAFYATLRTKRGQSDTSKPGGFIKDHVYLEGMFLIESFIAKGGDLRDLYTGKIGVADIHLLHETIIKPAKILPRFLDL